MVADYLGGGAVAGIPEVFDYCSHSTVVAVVAVVVVVVVVVEDGIEGDSEDDVADTASDDFDEGIEVACSCSCSYSYSRSCSLPDCCFDGYKSSERYLDNQMRYCFVGLGSWRVCLCWRHHYEERLPLVWKFYYSWP